MEPSTRPYNPSSQRVSRARGAGSAKRQESAAAQKSPATTPATTRASKPRARRAAAQPRAEAVEVIERPQPEPERLAPAGDQTHATDPAREIVAASPDLDDVAPVNEPGPLIGVDDFEDIFTRFQTPITNFIYRLVGNREQAFDLAQDVFVKAYRAL
ncbi:MAG TPA: sigma factor, partial [Ktedonobacterales bacterium]|nr:sigma factor [Ktedonobacterales bacterium]